MHHKIILSLITVGLDENEIYTTLSPLMSCFACSSVESIVVTPSPSQHLLTLLPHTNFLLDQGSGVYSAMNQGLSFASGTYIWYLNAGDQSLMDSVGMKSLINDLITISTNHSLQQLPIIFFGMSSLRLNSSFCLDNFLLKIYLLTLGMPLSHQNILFVRSSHNFFSCSYRYCCDFEVLSDIVLFSDSKALFSSSIPIAQLSPGFISDRNRHSVFRERFKILINKVHFYFVPLVVLGFIVRSLCELSRRIQLIIV